MEHILKLEQVKKYYGGAAGNITKAVDGISMEVNKGEFTARPARLAHGEFAHAV